MRLIKLLCLASTLLPASLLAATVTLDPSDGNITGLAGQPIGWGFTIINNSPVEWISFTESILVGESNPLLGVYSDFVGPQGGPTTFSVQPLDTWTESFSDASQTGIGEYLIDPSAVSGAQDSGVIRVMWEQFAGDPSTCNCSPAAFSQDVPFQLTVSNAPEPGAAWLAAVGCVWLLRRRRLSAEE